MVAPRVSVLIPTLNAERDLTRLLPALEGQRVEGGMELVVVDSDSDDCTRQLLRRAGARVEWIPRGSFRHGATRNALATLARGELCVFLSQDALPQGEDFLECLVAPLAERGVAGATARVLPHEDDDPLTARSALDAPEAGAEPGPIAGSIAGMGPASVRFNNVASAIRASVLRELPFPDVPFGEDVLWAESAMETGWRLAFAPDAVVRHAHRYTPSQTFARQRVDAAFQRTHCGRRLRSSPWDVLRGVAHELRRDLRFVAQRRAGWAHLLRSPGLRTAQVLGQWVGSRGPRGPQ